MRSFFFTLKIIRDSQPCVFSEVSDLPFINSVLTKLKNNLSACLVCALSHEMDLN